MRRFRCAVLAAVAVVGFASVASAADLPVKAPPMVAPVVAYNWTGFYVGIEGGGAWGSSTHDFNPLGTHSSFNVSGGLFGGTAGYNYQMGNFLAGIEGDLSWASSNGSTIGFPTLCTGGPC